MSFDKSNFYILTGGPGSGKTSVLSALAHRGYCIIPEVGRDIIQKQQKLGGSATHTGNQKAFRDLMLEQSIVDYCKMCSTEKPIFFDRGIPDLYGYSKTFCGEISTEVNDAVVRFRYNKVVFIFPPWLEIYKNDVERQQDFQEALKTYHALKEAYPFCGYELIEMPKGTIDERTDFILQTIAKSILDDLKNDINQLLGFHDDTPRINYGPCGVFAQLFFRAWNDHFKEKAHICFVMTPKRDECYHVLVRLPTGELYDGGIGIHSDKYYDKYIIDDMLEYNHDLLEQWSYGLDRTYPRFCPDFDKKAVNALINKHIKKLSTYIK